MTVRDGGQFFIGLDGPTGEAKHILVGIEDLQARDVVRREFTPDQAEDVANNLLEVVRLVREGK